MPDIVGLLDAGGYKPLLKVCSEISAEMGRMLCLLPPVLASSLLPEQ